MSTPIETQRKSYPSDLNEAQWGLRLWLRQMVLIVDLLTP